MSDTPCGVAHGASERGNPFRGLERHRSDLTVTRALTMKIKSLLAYHVCLLILFLLVFTVQVSQPAESPSVKACKQYAGCVAISQSVPNWLNLR